MRLVSRPLRRAAAPCCLAAAAVLLAVPAPAHADPAAAPACATPEARTFPLTTRIHGGPRSYPAGGGYGTWYLDLTNTTDRPCTGVHPVIVLVDEERELKPSQPLLEFYDGHRAQPHPVRFEATDRDELVGAFDDGFPGFTVGPGKTLSVKVRLAVTSDAVANRVTATAAVVQRRDDDGDWVGQSNDYRFAIDAPQDRPTAPRTGTSTDPGTGTGTDSGADTGSGTDTGTESGAATSAAPDAHPTAEPGSGTRPPATELPGRRDSAPLPGLPGELAATGPSPLARGALAATALLLLSGAALLGRRRRR
ncbi:hypothetical protein [Streptomyces glaucescens]|uniref:Gram-positive cocci surface proteins LPxTG domain-containing protein n=1 Tax=Streptomyces glaucescens TaxID=1907 RepID=A0A089X5W7_STRGA|nr:hypothetical protein [Streptomyces glaucescens]AIR98578.1 hypothetical protein SGLAU_12930 [Streptomyces glaucescens]